MTVLIIVIIVPIVVFGITAFITASVSRYDAQTRSLKALYLAQAGIHKGIFNIKATGAPTPVANIDANNQIAVTLIAQCSNIYQLKSIGTSVASGNSIARTLFAQYDATANKVSIYMEGDGTGIPAPACCDDVWWPFSEGPPATVTGTAPYQGALSPAANRPAWIADRLGAANRALRFNASGATNYVVVNDPASSSLDLTTAGTVMAWVYVDNPIAGAGVVNKGATTTASNAYALILNRRYASQARVNFWIYNAAGTQFSVSGSTDVGKGASTGWHHIAATWGPGYLRVYCDGQPDGTTVAVNPTARTNNNPLYIGAMGTLAAASEFQGRIDEVHVFSCQKTDQEILDYYNA